MAKNGISIIEGHESEDRLRIENNEYLQMVAEDFENAAEVLAMLKKGPVIRPEDIVMPVRKADAFSIHKHVTCFPRYTHSHKFYEMIYVHKGSCVQYTESDRPRIIKEREVCVLAPGAIHAMEPAAEDDLTLKLVIPQDLFRDAVTGIGITLDKFSGTDSVSYFTANGSRFTDLMLALLDETFSAKENKPAAIMHYLALLLLELTRDSGGVDKELYASLKKYIETDFSSATLSGYAAAEGYSPRHMGRRIIRGLGESFSDVLTSVRMDSASALLRQTDLAIENISQRLGYAGVSGFYKQFAARFGLTPGEYRNLNAQELV